MTLSAAEKRCRLTEEAEMRVEDANHRGATRIWLL
jgi:hypothetical protein